MYGKSSFSVSTAPKWLLAPYKSRILTNVCPLEIKRSLLYTETLCKRETAGQSTSTIHLNVAVILLENTQKDPTNDCLV